MVGWHRVDRTPRSGLAPSDVIVGRPGARRGQSRPRLLAAGQPRRVRNRVGVPRALLADPESGDLDRRGRLRLDHAATNPDLREARPRPRLVRHHRRWTLAGGIPRRRARRELSRRAIRSAQQSSIARGPRFPRSCAPIPCPGCIWPRADGSGSLRSSLRSARSVARRMDRRGRARRRRHPSKRPRGFTRSSTSS